MRLLGWSVCLLLACSMLGCSGGSSGSGGGFALIEFLESTQNNIPRNRQLRFRFSQPVASGQDLFTRLKIQNVNADPGESNFSRAQGFYLLNGDLVVFTPQLPTKPDRSDSGFRENGSYHVFLAGGPDGLASTGGDTIPTQQEFIFETNTYFEDVIPSDPPRALQLVAIDPSGTTPDVDISRLDPRPFEQSELTTAELLAAGNVIDPGGGGGPDYGTPWNLELRISETIDPSTVNNATVQLYEVREAVFSSPPQTPSATLPRGRPVLFRVAAAVETVQSIDPATGDYDIRVRVTPLQTLVDNTRYRLTFAGKILGIDYRKTFSGDNGLTGDGQTVLPDGVYEEPGGLGYVSEFLVYDRPSIHASRSLLYDPFVDGIQPEDGQTANTEADINSALYNPVSEPGTAVGFLSAFGKGTDGPLAASGGSPTVIDTGDTPNEPLGNPFTVHDLNPGDDYLGNTLPGGSLEYDSIQPFELQLESLVVSSSSTLRVTGVNPIVFRVTGLVQINGLLDVSGEDGKAASTANATGGAPGPGGYPGADSRAGAVDNCGVSSSTCANFGTYLNGCQVAKTAFPTATNGDGPGRGLAGGEIRAYPYDLSNTAGSSGGGGASHARPGTAGEDRKNASVADGSAGNCDTQYTYNQFSLSGVVGVRGQPGPVYGDRLIDTNTMGGSGGGAGGAHYQYNYSGANSSGGAGGGGGGHVSIIAAGPILVQGGEIDASGGNGGKGRFYDAYKAVGSSGWGRNTGGGGGGAGGSIALISGAQMVLTSGVLNAAGGAGGERGTAGTSSTANASNAGGDGGAGFILLMDADGDIEGFLPQGPETGAGVAEEYDSDARGVVTISPFDASRFSAITAITELFPVTAAKPAYLQYNAATDIAGFVANVNQRIRVRVSSATGSPDDPTIADPGTEIPDFEIAILQFGGSGTAVVVTGSMANLNATPGTPDRRAFVRVAAGGSADLADAGPGGQRRVPGERGGGAGRRPHRARERAGRGERRRAHHDHLPPRRAGHRVRHPPGRRAPHPHDHPEGRRRPGHHRGPVRHRAGRPRRRRRLPGRADLPLRVHGAPAQRPREHDHQRRHGRREGPRGHG